MSELSFSDFRGGLWIPDEAAPVNEQAGFAVPDNALLQADNLDYLPSGGVRGRRGSTLFSGSALAGPVELLRRYYGRPVPSQQLGTPIGNNFPVVGTVRWENPAGIEHPLDASYASAALIGGVQTEYLTARGPFYTNPLPANATITGLMLKVTGRCGSPDSFGPKVASVRLFKNFTVTGAEKSTAAQLTQALTVNTYGGPGDLWGTSLTAADVNATGFGIGVSYVGFGGANIAQIIYLTVIVFFSASEGTTLVAGHTVGSVLTYSSGAGGVFTPITGGSLANPLRRPRVLSWPQKGKLFFFDGVNPVTEFNGLDMRTTPTQPDVDPDNPNQVSYLPPRKGPYAALHKNRIYATDPGELAFSVYASDINNETAWRPELQLSVNDDRGGVITGIESFGDALLIFKDTSVWRFVGDPEFTGSLVQVAKVGCIAPDSIAVTPFGVLFLGREGLWLFDGEHLSLLSTPIRPLFVGRSDQHVYADAVGVYYPRRDQYWLHLDPAAGGPGYVLHRIAIAQGDGTEQQMLAWSRIPDLLMNSAAVFDGGGDMGELYLGDRNGYVWLRDTGTADFLLQYATTIVTAQRLIERERVLSRVNRIRPVFRGRGTLGMGLRYDQAVTTDVVVNVGTATATPTVQEPRRFITNMAKFGRFLAISAESSEGPEFELHRVDCDMRNRGGRVWR